MLEARREAAGIVKNYSVALKSLGINVERIVLYGSYAKGSQREDSDIDIIVISDDFAKLNLRERLEVLGIAAARIREPIEAKGYTLEEIGEAQEASFLKEVLEAGVNLRV